jgi:hypothetical protein
MQQKSNERLLNIEKMIQRRRSDLVELHDEVNLGYDVLLFGRLVWNILDQDE